jgi:hypothetical protein
MSKRPQPKRHGDFNPPPSRPPTPRAARAGGLTSYPDRSWLVEILDGGLT